MTPFTQLFGLAEVLIGKVLAYLSLNELSKLDVACNNKNMRAQLVNGYQHTISSCKNEKKLNGSLLYWIRSRGIRVNVSMMSCYNCPADDFLDSLAAKVVCVEQVFLRCPHNSVTERILACLHQVLVTDVLMKLLDGTSSLGKIPDWRLLNCGVIGICAIQVLSSNLSLSSALP